MRPEAAREYSFRDVRKSSCWWPLVLVQQGTTLGDQGAHGSRDAQHTHSLLWKLQLRDAKIMGWSHWRHQDVPRLHNLACDGLPRSHDSYDPAHAALDAVNAQIWAIWALSQTQNCWNVGEKSDRSLWAGRWDTGIDELTWLNRLWNWRYWWGIQRCSNDVRQECRGRQSIKIKTRCKRWK